MSNKGKIALTSSQIDIRCVQAKQMSNADRGCHYRWPEWIKIVDDAGLTRSMSRKGCSPDNAACEGFFGHLKNEMFYNRSWEGCSIAELKYEIDSYIRWYCTDRIKSTLGGLSPLQYRKELGVAVKKMSAPPYFPPKFSCTPMIYSSLSVSISTV